MSQNYDTPGVYIEEITGPSVITGVGTGTAAFIGPTLGGPINSPRRISSFDDFINLYGDPNNNNPYLYENHKRPFYLPFSVEGFFKNGGRQAYIVRVGTAKQAELTIQDQAASPQTVFIVRARKDGVDGNQIQVETQQHAEYIIVRASATVNHVDAANIISVDDASNFREGDIVTTDAANRKTVIQIQGNKLVLDAALAGAATGNTIRIANILPKQAQFRLEHTSGLRPGGIAIINKERVVIHSIDTKNNIVKLTQATINASNPGLSPTITIDLPDRFKVNDLITTDGVHKAKVTKIVGNDLTVDNLPAEFIPGAITLLYGSPPARVNPCDMSMGFVPPPTLTTVVVSAMGKANITAVNGASITVDSLKPFCPGDIVTVDGVDRAEITRFQNNQIILNKQLAGAEIINSTLRIADLLPTQMKFRVADPSYLYPGSVVLVQGDDATNPLHEVKDYVVVQGVDHLGFVTLENEPAKSHTYNLNINFGFEPILIPQEFRLIVTPPPPSSGINPVKEFHENLSLNPYHPRYIWNIGIFESDWVELFHPNVPPTTSTFPDQLVKITGPTALSGGDNDQPSGLTATHYLAGLDTLRDVDDVNLVCIPDASSHAERVSIQKAMIEHCLLMEDRFAILDSILGSPPSGPGSVDEQRDDLTSSRGFAALYYPWLMVRDPTNRGPQSREILIPSSGHIAGVFARTDFEEGVHKAPANTDVRGVLGLERLLSDGQQGPLNLRGINVLRIFPGSGQVTIWGARTTVDTLKDGTDWLYVPVRRLLLYIEESIQEGIRWAVFKPNNLTLWKQLKRTIGNFLWTIWQDGALFGEKAEDAYYVRIDEALNPPQVRNIGQLVIEIRVAPARPAEFIIVRIGLWDGGTEVKEI